MSEPYLVSLAGFTQFERDALAFCIRQAGSREPTYRLVDGLAQHDFVIADGDSQEVVAPLARDGHFHRTVFVGGLAAPDARARVSRPIDPIRILSCLDELAAQRLIQRSPPPLPWDPDQEQRLVARANARAAVRRARLENHALEQLTTESAHSVLVLDECDGDRERLCGLLTLFGFQPSPAQSLGEATELLGQRAYEAAFLALALDDAGANDAAALCQRIKQAETGSSAQAAVVLVSGTTQPADRVRAMLAGGDAVLTKPLGRGDVARVLESCNVSLPADPRRH